MLQKKICMIGSFAVGKTSLVRRFVQSIYSEAYHTTVGVKVDKKVVRSAGNEVTLVLWDIYGEDELQKMRWSYLRGAAGYLLVSDGTRRATLDKAVELEEKVRQEVGSIPFVFAVNKSDLTAEWDLDAVTQEHPAMKTWNILRTSAKTGEGVEPAFTTLTQTILGAG
jgi:small GTP-binding protein